MTERVEHEVATDDVSALPGKRGLTALEFQGLAQMPPSVKWFANLDTPRTRRAY